MTVLRGLSLTFKTRQEQKVTAAELKPKQTFEYDKKLYWDIL